MRVTWLADVLRDAGLEVVEHAGWKEHAAGTVWAPTFGVVHATAAPKSQADDVQVRIVRDGRAGLPGPIANACVDRRGRWHVLSAGRCNTTIPGTAGPFADLGNTHALGIEACNDNLSEPWPDVQYRAYARGWAAICRRLGWTQKRLVGHREHTPGHKTDPTFNMASFRGLVAEHIRDLEDDMALTDKVKVGSEEWTAGTAIGYAARKAYEIQKELAAARLRDQAILAAVQGVNEEAVLARVNEVAEQLTRVPAEVADALADANRPAQDTAAALRVVLGDRAAEVGRILAGQA